MNLIESGNYLIKIDNVVNKYGLFDRYPEDRVPEDPLNSLENPSYNISTQKLEEYSIDNFDSDNVRREFTENTINKIIYNKRLEKGFAIINENGREIFTKIFTFVELDENKKYTKEDILNIINIKSHEDNINWVLPDYNMPNSYNNLYNFCEKAHKKKRYQIQAR